MLEFVFEVCTYKGLLGKRVRRIAVRVHSFRHKKILSTLMLLKESANLRHWFLLLLAVANPSP